MFTRTLKFFAPVLFVASIALGGCASASPDIDREDNIASANEASTAAEGSHGQRGKHSHPLLVAALHDIELTAEQRKTIETALADLDSGQQGHMKTFHKALADDVRAGKIDESSIKAKIGDMDKFASERRAAVSKAIATLHSTLTAEQRTALVTHIKEQMQKFGGKHDKHEDKHEDKHDDQKDGEGHGPRGEGRGARGHHGGPMLFLLHGLDLTEEQREQIRAAMPPKPDKDADDRAAKHQEHRAQMDKALEAFKGATFDASAVLPEREHKGEHADRFIKMLKAAVPVLTAEQRAELAKRLEEGPRMGHPGGKRGPGHRGPGHHGGHPGGAAE